MEEIRSTWCKGSTLLLLSRGVDDWVNGKVIHVDVKDLYVEFYMWGDKYIQVVPRRSLTLRPYEHQIIRLIEEEQLYWGRCDIGEEEKDDGEDDGKDDGIDDGLDALF